MRQLISIIYVVVAVVLVFCVGYCLGDSNGRNSVSMVTSDHRNERRNLIRKSKLFSLQTVRNHLPRIDLEDFQFPSKITEFIDRQREYVPDVSLAKPVEVQMAIQPIPLLKSIFNKKQTRHSPSESKCSQQDADLPVKCHQVSPPISETFCNYSLCAVSSHNTIVAQVISIASSILLVLYAFMNRGKLPVLVRQSKNMIDWFNEEVVKESGFLQTFLLVFMNELGDKTFFIAALSSAKYGKLMAFLGSIIALVLMTICSTSLGYLTQHIPSNLMSNLPVAEYLTLVAFTFFGMKSLIDATKMKTAVNHGDGEKTVISIDERESKLDPAKKESLLKLILQVFFAEIGDRSFVSTILLSTTLNPLAVGTGAILAHTMTTAIAILGGGFLSKYLSEKSITYFGGVLFLLFALSTAVDLW